MKKKHPNIGSRLDDLLEEEVVRRAVNLARAMTKLDAVLNNIFTAKERAKIRRSGQAKISELRLAKIRKRSASRAG